MDTKTIKEMLINSYKGRNKKMAIDKHTLDKSLSGNRAQVYFDGEKATVVHRGTQDFSDIITDGLAGIGIETNRFKHGKKIEDKAIKKYGKDNITSVGHSLGGLIAERSNKKINTITLNKPVYPNEIIKVIPKNQIDIKTTNDIFSPLRRFQKGRKAINIKSTTMNPFKEHTVNTLNRINKKIYF